MKINISHKRVRTKNERRAVIFGYLWFFGSFVIVFLVPALAFALCNLFGVAGIAEVRIVYVSAGVAMICVGIYNIVGAALEFKHILVASQLFPKSRYRFDPDPRIAWTKKDKSEYIAWGATVVALGVAVILIFALEALGVLDIQI